MTSEKKMNQSNFEKIAKELTAFAEIIRSRQDEKQTIINDFGKERKRLKAGKISKKALISSVPRVNKELLRINVEIKKNIKNLHRVAEKTKKFASMQSPKTFKVSTSGMIISGKKKKRTHKKVEKR